MDRWIVFSLGLLWIKLLTLLSNSFKGAEDIYMLTSKVWEVQLFCLLANTWHCNFTFGGYVMVSPCGLNLHFPEGPGQTVKVLSNLAQLHFPSRSLHCSWACLSLLTVCSVHAAHCHLHPFAVASVPHIPILVPCFRAQCKAPLPQKAVTN